VASLEISDAGLGISWEGDGRDSHYPWFWLRDHGHEEATRHPITQQRRLLTAALSDDIRGTAATLAPDGQSLTVDWSSGERSHFPIAFLWRFREPRLAIMPG
jgi:hypothetical protein